MRQPAGKLANRFHLLRLPKLVFDRALFGQVTCDFGESDQLSLIVANGIDNHAGPEPGAVLSNPPPFGFKTPFALGCFKSNPRDLSVAILGRVESREVLTRYFLGPIALEALRPRVPAADTAVRIEHVDRIIGNALNE